MRDAILKFCEKTLNILLLKLFVPYSQFYCTIIKLVFPNNLVFLNVLKSLGFFIFLYLLFNIGLIF